MLLVLDPAAMVDPAELDDVFVGDRETPDPLIDSGTGWVLLLSAISNHLADITVERWSLEPPAAPGDARGADTVFTLVSGSLEFAEITGEPATEPVLLGSPARLNLRCRCRGRRDVVRAVEQAGGAMPEGVERWTLQFWPVELAGPTTVNAR